MSIQREVRALRREVAELREALKHKADVYRNPGRPSPHPGFPVLEPPLVRPGIGRLVIRSNPNEMLWNNPAPDASPPRTGEPSLLLSTNGLGQQRYVTQ